MTNREFNEWLANRPKKAVVVAVADGAEFTVEVPYFGFEK